MWQLNWRTIMIAVMIATPPTMLSLVSHLASRDSHAERSLVLEGNRTRLEEIHLLVNAQRAELMARHDALMSEIIDVKGQLTRLHAICEPPLPAMREELRP